MKRNGSVILFSIIAFVLAACGEDAFLTDAENIKQPDANSDSGSGSGSGTGTAESISRGAQLTDNPLKLFFYAGIKLSGNGSVAIYVSDSDPLGTNSDSTDQAPSSELFAINTDGTNFRQLTDTDGDPSIYSTDISADGGLIAFESGDDPLGSNTDLNQEVFTINSDGTGLTQLTNTSNPSQFVSMTDDGSLIVFESGDEIFSINSNGTGLTQVSNFSVAANERVTNLILSGDGSRIIFFSTADLVTGNNTDNSDELFVINIDGSGLQQITDGVDDGGIFSLIDHRPAISADGSLVVFTSRLDLVNSRNSDGSSELFAYYPGTDTLNQVTDLEDPPGEVYGAFDPDISDDGATIIFGARFDLDEGNNTGNTNAIFLTNAGGTTFTQISPDGESSIDSNLSANAGFLLYVNASQEDELYIKTVN